jgi:hypothetical protein
MRFRLDVHFLDRRGDVVGSRLGLPPRRIAIDRRAAGVLELVPEEL